METTCVANLGCPARSLLCKRTLKEANVRGKVDYFAGLGLEITPQLRMLGLTLVFPHDTVFDDGLRVERARSAGRTARIDIDYSRQRSWEVKHDFAFVIGRLKFCGNEISPCLRISLETLRLSA